MTTRRLAAILAADVVGFSKLIGEDEAGTLAALREIRRGIVNPVLARPIREGAGHGALRGTVDADDALLGGAAAGAR
jgi:class 3 adenylate cyclase